jgi:hypothetical protein
MSLTTLIEVAQLIGGTNVTVGSSVSVGGIGIDVGSGVLSDSGAVILSAVIACLYSPGSKKAPPY